MLIKATLQLSEAEKVALARSQWNKCNKATLNKFAKDLPLNLIADLWTASAEELINIARCTMDTLLPLFSSGGGSSLAEPEPSVMTRTGSLPLRP